MGSPSGTSSGPEPFHIPCPSSTGEVHKENHLCYTARTSERGKGDENAVLKGKSRRM